MVCVRPSSAHFGRVSDVCRVLEHVGPSVQRYGWKCYDSVVYSREMCLHFFAARGGGGKENNCPAERGICFNLRFAVRRGNCVYVLINASSISKHIPKHIPKRLPKRLE